MAIVNIDLSEYDASRNRNRELEEQVKELKKINEDLKSNAKVILRKETISKTKIKEITYHSFGGVDTVDKPTKINVNTSESYVNFEDVRLKVENEMRKEIEESIEIRKRYEEKYKALDDEFQQKRAELEESCKKKLLAENDKMRDAYLICIKAKEEIIKGLEDKIKKNHLDAETALGISEGSFFKSKKVENILQNIVNTSAEL